MILLISALLVLFLTFLRFSVALLNMVSRPYLPEVAGQQGDLPSLSVLIPVRNEEKNIDRLLGSLASLAYRNAEILVYDDGSADGSEQLIRGYEALDRRVRYMAGTELPPGWTGKNRACHNLAMAANGDYLLFLDADVIVGYDLLRRAVIFARRHNLALLSMFPEQVMRTRGERIVVPFMFRILLSLLPLFLVRRCRWTSFAAANGQMMLFRGDLYRRYMFHEAVKERLAEDIEIMRLVKRKKLRGDTLVGGKEIRCRMYRSYSEGITGFSRNIFPMFGNSVLFFLLFSLTGLAGWILFLYLPWYFLATYIFMIVGLNAMIAVTSRQRVWENLKCLLPGIAAFYHIAFTAIVKTFRRSYEWKGREVR
jgi:chlorobactene glucosyltransferase